LEQRDGIFTLMNARDTGTVCHNELRPKLKTWAQNMGFEERRINQIWFATWEAVYNAIEHGSKPGDTIHIRLILPKSTSLLEVEVKQPLIWKNWDRYLGRERIETQTDPVSMDEGIGTSTMLWLADEIHVTELGRQITMRFSPMWFPHGRSLLNGPERRMTNERPES
jgi:anti-sigma regulatory factor (Ser/Thr protein kinase)